MKNSVAIYYGSLSMHPSRRHLSAFNTEIIEQLFNKGILQKVICMEADGFDHCEGLKIAQFSGSFLSRLAMVCLRILKLLKINHHHRLTHELFFDLFASLHIGRTQKIILLKIHYSYISNKLFNKSQWIAMLGVFPRRFLKNIIDKDASHWGLREDSYYTNEKIVRNQEKYLTKATALISLTSSEIAKTLLKDYDAKLYEKVLFPNNEFGVDHSVFFKNDERYKSSSLKVLITADNTLKKGLIHLLSALSQMMKNYPDLNMELNVIGSIPDNHQKVIDQLLPVPKITNHGFVRDIETHYRNNDIFIAASIIDMGPRTIKQAMASGILTICTKQCGGASFINSDFTYDYDDYDSLISILVKLSKQPDLLKTEGDANLTKAKSFSNDLFATDIANIIAKI